MNTSATTNPLLTPSAAPAGDPAGDFAVVAHQVADLIGHIESLPADALARTVASCPEFNVDDLLDHVVMVVRRVATLGAGGSWDDVGQERLGGGWQAAYRDGWERITQVWGRPEQLGALYQVPWGEIPGVGVYCSYTAELAVHGWDLAQATGTGFTVDDDRLQGAWQAVQFLPAEGRGGPEVPFGPVVDPGSDAPMLDRLAGWMGRAVV
jgi:uncharacterized protein (TIGR03086 family)